MGRRASSDPEANRCVLLLILALTGLLSCAFVYTVLSTAFNPTTSASASADPQLLKLPKRTSESECCRGVENLEFWGSAVKWGSEFRFNSSEECCSACKAMCTGADGPCLCDSWVFCGSREACGPKFGECWLKKQKDTLAPERQDSGEKVVWTSGLIFGKGEGIVGMETEHGTLHIKLLPDYAPHSVNYILQLLEMRHCAGCHFYRAEGRGSLWDSEGNHIKDASFGPPFALIQGTLEAQGATLKNIPVEACPTIRRGSVAWVGSGPEFFISLANHDEWNKAYTVFGTVLPEDMEVVEKIAKLPTKPDAWNNVNVSVLEQSVPLLVRRIKRNNANLSL